MVATKLPNSDSRSLADNLVHAHSLGLPVGGAIGESQVRGDSGHLSQPAQHITLDDVCTRAPRANSRSGVGLVEQSARGPSASSRMERPSRAGMTRDREQVRGGEMAEP